jgi:Flp pilus assembly protein TadD
VFAGQPSEGARWFRRGLVTLDAPSARFTEGAALAHLSANQFDAALAAVEEARQAPDTDEVACLLATAVAGFSLGRDDAEAAYDQALRLLAGQPVRDPTRGMLLNLARGRFGR